MKIPAISVIIPLYNAENFISECLDSVLSQTLQDFEIIVVDDCSTDNSVAIVESYAEKFGGRLALLRTKKNSGCAGVPKNRGFNYSRGEYVFFLDADDAIIPTAFEELYRVAKNFSADVVACEKYYEVPVELWHNNEFRKNLEPVSYQTAEFVTAPTLLTANLFERVQRYYQGGFLWNIWSKLIRRNFILENEISFTEAPVGEDMIFTGCLLFAAEKYILVPNVINFYRFIEGSISHPTDFEFDYFRKYLKALTKTFNYFEKFLRGRDFFRQHPDKKYLALERVWLEIRDYVLEFYDKVPVYEFDGILREEFSATDNVALNVFAFNAANIYSRRLSEALQAINESEKDMRRDKAYISELENFILNSQQRIAALEDELKHKE